MFCVETSFGDYLLFLSILKTEMSIHAQSRLWACWVINLSCLAPCWSTIKCTVVLSKSKMLLWKIFATWQCPFKLGKELSSCLNSCIPIGSQEWQQHRLADSSPKGWTFCLLISWSVSTLHSSEMRTFNPALFSFLHSQVQYSQS